MSAKKMMFALCGAMAFASVATANAYTSASYVQDGLVAQWDGIDNTGAGVHNPGAKKWKDLAGVYDLTLLPNGSWSADGRSLSVYGAAAVCSNSLPAYKTIEVVYKMKKPDGRLLFCSGGTSQVNDFRFVVFNRDGETAGTTGYFSGAWKVPAPHVVWSSFDPSAVRSMAATYNNGEAYAENGNVSAVYADGAVRDDGSADTSWGLGDGHIMIGDRAEAGSYPWFGEVYTIRVYDRALSAAEIAANHAIDEARFYAPAQDEGYVSDGLVARWDGIDNAGTGTHDPNATVWKDLAGNIDLTLAGDSVGWTGGNALNLAAFGDHAFNDNTGLMPKYKTIEIVCKETDWNGRVMFHSGDITRAVYFDKRDAGNGSECVVYFSGIGHDVYTKRIIQPFVDSEVMFLAARYGDDNTVADLFRDAENRDDGQHNNDWWNGAKITVGCVYTPAHTPWYNEGDTPARMYDWKGEVYAIRLYNRRLTKWELAHNNMLDRKRFLNSGSYIKRGLSHHWDGIDNAGTGVHSPSAGTWKDLGADGYDLTVKASGQWADNALACLGTGIAAQNESHNSYFETLEVVFRNWSPGGSVVLYSGGYNIARYCCFDANYAMWTYRQSSSGFKSTDTDATTLSWVSSSEVYANGNAIPFETVEDNWNAGNDTIQVGDRIGGTSYPFTGDIYAIRTYYSTQLTAYEIAYNAKVDDARFFTPNGGRSLTWKGPEATLTDGVFGSNGCWNVAGVKRSRAIPTIGDRVSLPVGDYTVTLDESNWSLGSLSIGAGATLAIPMPAGAYDADKALLELSGGLDIDATGEIVLDGLSTFIANHSRWQITLLSCENGHADALNALAAKLSASLPLGRIRVVDGNSLVYRSPLGFVMLLR
ncbi:MAG: LamG domain-containing protein [Kiritimatiellae bacterium]|nr:LamG domain-containing protein [Kiritimatiellia bacterium]